PVAVEAEPRDPGRHATDRELDLGPDRAIADDHVGVAELVDDLLVGEPDVAPARRGERGRLAAARDAVQRGGDRSDPDPVQARRPGGELARAALEEVRVELAGEERGVREDAGEVLA